MHATAKMRFSHADPVAWNAEFKFTVVRNPWAQAVSFYNLASRGVYKSVYPKSFREWLLNGMPTHWGPPEFPTDPMDQWNYFTDGSDNDLVDTVIKYEELKDCLPELCQRLGHSPQAAIPLVNGSARNWSYQPYYDRMTRGILAERYPKLCARFGYKY